MRGDGYACKGETALTSHDHFTGLTVTRAVKVSNLGYQEQCFRPRVQAAICKGLMAWYLVPSIDYLLRWWGLIAV